MFVNYLADVGYAEGCFCDMRGDEPPFKLTYYPKAQRYALYTGRRDYCQQLRTHNGGVLWPQEAYVFRREARHILNEMLERLDRMKPRPRARALQYMLEPLPEDFGYQPLPIPKSDIEQGDTAMTWNIAFDGTPQEVTDKLQAHKHLPMPLSTMLVECLSAFPESEQCMLDTHGSLDPEHGEGNAFIKLSVFRKKE